MEAITDDSSRTLIDELLAEQQRLTAVERFARKHEQGGLPAQARYYRSLLPASPPAPGEQYAFAVDLDVCTGCKACVSACHSLNGLDDEETWRDIGLLVGGTIEKPYQQTVTTACHHCVDPACAAGCPVLAYEKDEETGIVRHLDDQCIGCQYCVLKCPYDVPKYSEKRGIVRKCDMCHSRLAAGEAPACVQACPNGAITIRTVSKEEVRAGITSESRVIPGAFPSTYTQPTTEYRTRKGLPANALPANAGKLRLEHAHWPLIWMLLLTQVSTGIFVALASLGFAAPDILRSAASPLSITAFAILNLGLGVSVLHLGRPLGAWRAFLGLRRSWMSREIVGFSVFAGAAGALVTAAIWPMLTAFVPQLSVVEQFVDPGAWVLALASLTSVTGLLAVFCSAMIYIDTHRPYWAAHLTVPKFFGTTLLLGTAGAAAVLGWFGAITHDTSLFTPTNAFVLAATLIRAVLFGWEWKQLQEALENSEAPTHRSALLIWKLMKPLAVSRAVLFAGATGFGVATLYHSGQMAAAFATASFLLTFASQTIERFFFFTAMDAPRMPGGVAA
ncbi:MAG: molybdopterin oxidoreductase [Verrucomicrobiaceae bacterium]|nr:MAG: molybdopterin oxidoreductase [Verrucomicrobiaceae bacterium]